MDKVTHTVGRKQPAWPRGLDLKQLVNKEPTIQDLAGRYVREHVEVHCKPRTIAGYRDHLRRFILPAMGDIKVSDLTRAEVSAFHSALSDIPYQANRCLEIISKMFNLAEIWDWRPVNTNPRTHIKKYRERMRERYLTKEEAKRLFKALDVPLENPITLSASYCIRLLLFTGCRLREIQTLKWEYVDFHNSCLRLPDSKTGPRTIYISQEVMDLLYEIAACPVRPADNPHVIWGRNTGAHLQDIQKRWRKFRTKAGLPDMRIHDLRHSFASFAAAKGMSLEMIGKLLGHSQIQTTARYTHLMGDQIKDAANTVVGEISRAIYG